MESTHSALLYAADPGWPRYRASVHRPPETVPARICSVLASFNNDPGHPCRCLLLVKEASSIEPLPTTLPKPSDSRVTVSLPGSFPWKVAEASTESRGRQKRCSKSFTTVSCPSGLFVE